MAESALTVLQVGNQKVADFRNSSGVSIVCVDSSNVGIGTNPDEKLHVYGTIKGVTLKGDLSNSLLAGAYLTGGSYKNDAQTTFAVDATSANTASKVVARDASGNFSAGTITAALSGNATTATTLQTARNINGVSFNGSADITITANTPNTLTRGSYLTGNNFNGGAGTTWAVDATSANTASKVVARDGSGNFSSGFITCTGASVNGKLYIGTTSTNYTGAWEPNMRIDCADYAEMTIHDANTRVVSPIFYDGPGNRIYIGRDIGWGTTPVSISNSVSTGSFYANNGTMGTVTSNDTWTTFGWINSSMHPYGYGAGEVGASSRPWSKMHAGAFTTVSDKREKENITDYLEGLEFILKLQPKHFNYIRGNKQKKNGFIAQDIVSHSPSFVGIDYDTECDRYSIVMDQLIAPLVNSIKELHEENRSLKQLVTELMLRVSSLESKA